MTIFALSHDPERRVTLVVDEGLLAHDPVHFHPLKNDATTAISPADRRKFIGSLRDEDRQAFCAPEIHRIEGEILLREGALAEAEHRFHAAVDVARQRSEKSLELRATLSLARLWRQQGKQAEARRRLAAIYGWFTEGFDTADLRAARALLDA